MTHNYLSAIVYLITRFSLSILAISLMVIAIAPPVGGQSSTATLSGIVLDPNDAAVPGATVIVVNTETKRLYQANTDRTGHFVITLLPPDRYSVTVEQEGFAKLEIKDLVLNVNGQLSIPVHLNVGEISETVTVEGTALIQTESAAVSTVIDNQFVKNLPLNGRSFGSLIELHPALS